jgi:hypothetical protein
MIKKIIVAFLAITVSFLFFGLKKSEKSIKREEAQLQAFKKSSSIVEQKSFLVVGTVRNCSKFLDGNIKRFKASLAKAKELHWLIIESDSDDESLRVLDDVKKNTHNFNFISLGKLRDKMPLRTERLAYCRNAYAQEIKTNPLYKNIDYVVVADLDDVNSHISEMAILSCWERDDWHVCCANQKGPYYDIWALRHKDWCPNDCWAQFGFLDKYSKDKEKNLYASVQAKQIIIPAYSEWIEVDSAFGGLAIYQKKLFNVAPYVGIDEQGKEVCEHVAFHNKLREKGYRIFINPKMVNSGEVKWYIKVVRFFSPYS